MDIKWKPMPRSFPNQSPGHVSAADLNEFFDTQDTEVATNGGSSLQRDESFADSTHSETEPQSKFSNSRLMRTRDSIFITKDHLRHINHESDDETDEEENKESPIIVNEEEPVQIRRPISNLSNRNESARKSRVSVRFSNIPNETRNEKGYTNSKFIDDYGNEPEDYVEKGSVDTTEWQRNGENDELWTHHSSDEDDESALDYSKPAWDSFLSLPTEDVDQTINSPISQIALKIFKLGAYITSFMIILFTGVISKLSFVLVSGMTRVNKTVVICNSHLPNVLDHDKHYHSWLGLHSVDRFAWLWVLFFILITPDLLTFLRSLKICLFKQYEMPDSWSIIVIFGTHSAEVIGVSLFAFVLIPSVDAMASLVFTNCLFLLPSYCLMMARYRKQTQESQNQMENGTKKPSNDNFFYYFYLVAFVFQIVALIAWPVILHFRNSVNFSPLYGLYTPRDETAWLWIIPISGLLISLGYWENFTTEDSEIKFLKTLGKIKKLSIANKYAVYLYVSIWKCFLYFVMLLLIQAVDAFYHEGDLKSSWDILKLLFTNFIEAFTSHQVDLIRENSKVNSALHTLINGWPPVIIGLIQIGSSLLCYCTVLFVCKICIQPFSFAIPVHLIVPVSVSVMNFFANKYAQDVCFFSDIFSNIFWNVHYNVFDLSKGWNWAILFLWLITFTSQVIVTSHVWISSKERLASIHKLFILPFYNSAILEQSIMLNRRIDEDLFANVINNEDAHTGIRDSYKDDNSVGSTATGIDSGNTAEKIRIYACATVWHETADELVKMLKSIMRMDEDQAQRRLAVKWLNVKEHQVDYYEFETHLFVDDAFVFGETVSPNDRHINEYVKILIDVLNEAAENVHQRPIRIRPPRIYVTPYGGRIEWRLPGGTKLIAHLKDKLKIRHRKRWSQVMYMYYLLGFKIYEKEPDEDKRKKLTEKTFILALDGDINFRPEAVLLLVDLMKKNLKLGAACGRVNPVGTGPIAWYQVFEYAISHWLQKATEHVFGCVLCSPGCFSLFRASALVDINVMNKYTTKPTEAIHYVQYDQGEDRWLCTLMLQQGWRVEYSAASDSYTHCPEGFGEFYIQRRRWAPSTMANILDLLGSYKNTVKKNDNISSLYILYQASLMLGTILSPGTIFLMLVGANSTAFNMPTQYSFYLNFFPVLGFVLVCFFCKTEIQILIAQILSTFYAMLMLAVITSTFIEIKKETIFSPSVIFFVGMIVVFIVAAVVHPQEFQCLLPAPVYLLTIPSMYLLLTIYSIINLNIVTWGTRENTNTSNQQQPAQVQKKDSNLLVDIGSYLNPKNKWNFNCMCCTSTTNDEELFYLRDIKESIKKVNTEIYDIKNATLTQTKLAKADLNLKRRNSVLFASRKVTFNDSAEMRPLMEFMDDEDEDIDDVMNAFDSTIEQATEQIKTEMKEETEQKETFSAENPPWVRDEGLENAKVVSIKENERAFWIAFLAKYLAPLFEDKAHQDKVAADLIDLRNKVVFGFGIINIIFVLFVFLLQLNKDIFSITFHMNRHPNGTTIDPDTGDPVVVYEDTPVNMDPIGLVLIIFFGSILIIQCIGMFLHRFGTIMHLLAFVDISFFQVREKDIHDDRIVDQNSVPIVKFIMKKYDKEEDDDLDFSMEKHFQKYYLRMKPQNLAIEMKLPRRKSIATALATRQRSARRMSLSADMHARYLRQFGPRHQPNSQFYTESEPEVITQFELDQNVHEHSDSDDDNGTGFQDVRVMSTHFAQNVIHDALASFNPVTILNQAGQVEESGRISSEAPNDPNEHISVATINPSSQGTITHL